MQRNKGQEHVQPDNPEADYMPCCANIVTAPATPVQRQAWACLWSMLLAETGDRNGNPARREEGEHHD